MVEVVVEVMAIGRGGRCSVHCAVIGAKVVVQSMTDLTKCNGPLHFFAISVFLKTSNPTFPMKDMGELLIFVYTRMTR